MARQAELEPLFAETSFFESLRIEPYYQYTATRVPEADAFLAALIDETSAQHLALVHGDYSPKNILVHRGQLVLLDHEVIHFGDPAFDLGFSLTHLLSKAHHLSEQRKEFQQAAQLYWTTYRAAVGDLVQTHGFEPRAVRHTLACLLARVEGRSPLEYLSPEERQRQRAAALQLIRDQPGAVPALVDRFVALC
jgi:hypothetical protein